jgi:hypothetical protein
MEGSIMPLPTTPGCALSHLILGYAHKDVNEAIMTRAVVRPDATTFYHYWRHRGEEPHASAVTVKVTAAVSTSDLNKLIERSLVPDREYIPRYPAEMEFDSRNNWCSTFAKDGDMGGGLKRIGYDGSVLVRIDYRRPRFLEIIPSLDAPWPSVPDGTYLPARGRLSLPRLRARLECGDSDCDGSLTDSWGFCADERTACFYRCQKHEDGFECSEIKWRDHTHLPRQAYDALLTDALARGRAEIECDITHTESTEVVRHMHGAEAPKGTSRTYKAKATLDLSEKEPSVHLAEVTL